MKETVPISKFLEDYPALKTAFEVSEYLCLFPNPNNEV